MGLWYEVARLRTRKITVTSPQLQKLIGGSRNSFPKARTELVAAGLVVTEPCGTAGWTFEMCDPATGRPWPLKPTEKPSYSTSSEPLTSAEPLTPDAAIAGVEFPFGYNVIDADGSGLSVSNSDEKGGIDIGALWR